MADKELKTLLSELREIDFTALDYSTIQEELIDYIRTAQSNQGLVDDFLEGDAAKILIDLFSYLGELLAFRIDTMSNETYLPTAQRRQSIINLLEIVGQRVKNPTESSVSLIAIPDEISSSDIQIPARHQFSTTGLDGSSVQFEIMNSRDDYFTPVFIEAGSSNTIINAYSGTYVSENRTSTGQANQEIELTKYPVIEDTIRVSVTSVASSLLTSEIIKSTRVTEVTSLIDSSNDIIYQVKFDEDGRAKLVFATEFFGKIPPKNHTIHIDYRIGGGSNTNVAAGSISTSSSFSNLGGQRINVSFSNDDFSASGGIDKEDLDIARLRVPGLVRSNQNLVTSKDYEANLREISGVQDVFAVDRFEDQSIYNNIFDVASNSVKIWVLPITGGDISPDLAIEIQNLLESGRLTAIDNQVFNPIYNNWSINAEITLTKLADAQVVRDNVTTALLDKYGFSNATFRNKIKLSQIIATIQNVSGVDFVELNTPTFDLVAEPNEVLRLLDDNISLSINQAE